MGRLKREQAGKLVPRDHVKHLVRTSAGAVDHGETNRLQDEEISRAVACADARRKRRWVVPELQRAARG